MDHPGKPRGRDGQRHRHVYSQATGFQRTVLDISCHALTQFDVGEVSLIGVVGALGPGAAVNIVVEHAWHTSLGHLAQVFDASDDGHCPAPQ
ncbi:hypothetical protein D9M73_271780 [compost metagenome]